VSEAEADWLRILVALLGGGVAVAALITWALWLQRRLPKGKSTHWLPLVVSLAPVVPLGIGLRLVVHQLIDLLQAVPHVRPVDKDTLVRAALVEILDRWKTVELLFAVLSLSCLIVLVAVTGIERRVLFRPPPSGR
jgi:hypothetical protein